MERGYRIQREHTPMYIGVCREYGEYVGRGYRGFAERERIYTYVYRLCGE